MVFVCVAALWDPSGTTQTKTRFGDTVGTLWGPFKECFGRFRFGPALPPLLEFWIFEVELRAGPALKEFNAPLNFSLCVFRWDLFLVIGRRIVFLAKKAK